MKEEKRNIPTFILEKGSKIYFQFQGDDNTCSFFKAEHIETERNGLAKFLPISNSQIKVNELTTDEIQEEIINDNLYKFGSMSSVYVGGIDSTKNNNSLVPGYMLFSTPKDGVWMAKEHIYGLSNRLETDGTQYIDNKPNEEQIFDNENLNEQ